MVIRNNKQQLISCNTTLIPNKFKHLVIEHKRKLPQKILLIFALFSFNLVPLNVITKIASTIYAVSYTHLDVYKRQAYHSIDRRIMFSMLIFNAAPDG